MDMIFAVKKHSGIHYAVLVYIPQERQWLTVRGQEYHGTAMDAHKSIINIMERNPVGYKL